MLFLRFSAVMPPLIRVIRKWLLQSNYFAPVAGKKRARTFALKLIVTVRRFAERAEPLCFALKWF